MENRANILLLLLLLAVSMTLALRERTRVSLVEQNEALRSAVQALQQPHNEKISTSALEKPTGPQSLSPKEFLELQRLRGEVALLREETQERTGTLSTENASALSGITEAPEMWKALRDQQKLGLGMVYQEFGKVASLSTQEFGAFIDLLADDVMTNVHHITSLLRDRKGPEELERTFQSQEAKLQSRVRELLGSDLFGKYEEYTPNLGSYLTSEQFKAMMQGDQEARETRARQLFQLMKESTREALDEAKLPPNFQTVPTLNFRNFASEEVAEQNLQLLDRIYERVQTRAVSFLTAEDLESFSAFREKAIHNNRLALAFNRKIMAPTAKP